LTVKYNAPIIQGAKELAEKYATVGHDFDGMNYRTIARKMTNIGHRMNHATARNILHAALTKIAGCIVTNNNVPDSNQDPNALARSATFQAAIGAIVQDIYSGEQ